VLEFAAQPSRLGEALGDDDEAPVRLVAAGGRGTYAAVDASLADEVVERAQSAAMAPVARTSGALVSVIFRPGTPVATIIEEQVPSSWRALPHLLHGPRSASLLVHPQHGDEAVLVLHRALIETPLVPDSVSGRSVL
jgi:hypothetical protein